MPGLEPVGGSCGSLWLPGHRVPAWARVDDDNVTACLALPAGKNGRPDGRLLCRGGGLPDVDRNFRRMQQRVVNQAMMDRALDPGLMLLGQLDWSLDLDPKIVDARRRLFDFVGGQSHSSALARQLEFAKV